MRRGSAESAEHLVCVQMPRIWVEFCSLLVDQRFVTRARRAFDRAICALPITQHDRIWQLYLVRCLSTAAAEAASQPRALAAVCTGSSSWLLSPE